MERLTMEHVLSLIQDTQYEVDPQVTICKLTVGDVTIVGTSYCFSKSTFDPERGKKSAYDDAVKQLFALEAYHQKRLRAVSNMPVIEKEPHTTKGKILSDVTSTDANGNFVSRDVVYQDPYTGGVGYDRVAAPGIDIKSPNTGYKASAAEMNAANSQGTWKD